MKQSMLKLLSCVLMAFALVSFVGCESTPTTRSAAEATEDAAITGKVKSALALDSTVKALDINVDTFRNVVTLKGNVASQAVANKAVEIARGVSGVKSVVNKLSVK